VKYVALIWIIFLLFFVAGYAQVQPADSLSIVRTDSAIAAPGASIGHEGDTPYHAAMTSFMILILITFLSFFIGAGIVVTLLVLLLLSGLISAGIVSVSILVGISQKSVAKGFKTFLLSAASVSGSLSGAIMLFAINNFFLHRITGMNAALIGALAGFLGGMIVAFFIFRVLQWIFNYYTANLNIKPK
jgi:hypothetical protein